MLAKLGRPSHATVVAYAALFIAVGGVSYAAVTLPANSVGSKQIKRGGVKSSDLAKNAVTSAKVKDFSLLSKDFKPGQLVAGAAGTTGAPGPKGDKGDKGDTGPTATNPPPTLVKDAPADSSGDCGVGTFCHNISTWTNYGGSYAPAGYYKDIGGNVHLVGLAKATTTESCGIDPFFNVFVLPPGYRPGGDEAFTSYSDVGTQVTVTADGVVRCDTGHSNIDVHLSGIEFQATH